MVERFLQFEAATANVLEVLAQEANIGSAVDASSGFIDFLPVHQDLAGENEGLGPFAGGAQTAFEQKLVETNFQHEPRRWILPSMRKPESKCSCRFSVASCQWLFMMGPPDASRPRWPCECCGRYYLDED